MWFDEFRRRTSWTEYANRRRYDSPADPWRRLRVDPQSVELWTPVDLKEGLGQVRAGNWDSPSECRPIAQKYIYEGLLQRFVEGREWTETVYRRTVADRIAERGAFRGYRSVAELDAEFLPAIDDLYATMREEGYRPNHGTVYDSPGQVDSVHELEPIVLIGRDGDLVWTEGYHRFTIARLLDIETIPVYVFRRHESWQRIRDRALAAGTDSDLLDRYGEHPDLRDVLDD